jgi:aromatic-L-amino-acid decarboxylase
VVCFRARPDAALTPEDADAFNSHLLDAVNATGDVFLSHTRLHGRFTLRLAIGHLRTTELHVRRAWDLLGQHVATLRPTVR